jgi:hypothetical protein
MEKHDLTLTSIWQNATWGAGCIGDAIKAKKEDPDHDATKELGDALVLLDKATGAIQNILATSYLNRRSTPS